jgi:hypothetical protein
LLIAKQISVIWIITCSVERANKNWFPSIKMFLPPKQFFLMPFQTNLILKKI